MNSNSNKNCPKNCPKKSPKNPPKHRSAIYPTLPILTPTETTRIKNYYRTRIKTVLKSYNEEEIKKKSLKTAKTLLLFNKFRTANSIAIFWSLPFEFQTESIIRYSFDNNKHVYLPRVTNMVDSTMEMLEIYGYDDYNNGGEYSYYKIFEPKSHFCKGYYNDVIKPYIDTRMGDYGYVDGLCGGVNDRVEEHNNGENNNDKNNNEKLLLLPRPNLLQDDCIKKLDLLLCPFLVCDGSLTRIGYGAGYYDRYINRLQARRIELGLKKVPIWGIGLGEQFLGNLVVKSLETNQNGIQSQNESQNENQNEKNVEKNETENGNEQNNVKCVKDDMFIEIDRQLLEIWGQMGQKGQMEQIGQMGNDTCLLNQFDIIIQNDNDRQNNSPKNDHILQQIYSDLHYNDLTVNLSLPYDQFDVKLDAVIVEDLYFGNIGEEW
jgi:5-formyltetrahydrofolate cyclo-ligase